jgi:hypothetical protein
MQQSLEPLAIEGSSYGERARGELLFAYRQGRGAENLRRLADEVSLNNKSRAKNAQSKQSILSLALVTTACIVPALFAAYASVGSSLLQSSVDGTTAFIVLAILFPLANAGLLALVRFLGD